MDQPLTVVLLAGTLRPSPLRAALDVPVLRLPMGREGAVLDCWLRSMSDLEGLSEIQIVVNSDLDVQRLSPPISAPGDVPIRLRAEPASWRGAGGIVHDVMEDASLESIVIVAEANILPPSSLSPLLEAWSSGVGGLVGVGGVDEPAGVYVFTRHSFECVPPIGYFDLKEQFLPALAREGVNVAPVPLGERMIRLRDRKSYLSAVRRSLQIEKDGGAARRVSSGASVSGSAMLDGFCIVEEGAVIEDGAVVHDTVVLSGATIGGGAVVSRSIVGPLCAVAPRQRVVREVVFEARRREAGRQRPRPRPVQQRGSGRS